LGLVALLSIALAWLASQRRQSERELQIANELEARGAIVERPNFVRHHDWSVERALANLSTSKSS
jgi:hypothetical protein